MRMSVLLQIRSLPLPKDWPKYLMILPGYTITTLPYQVYGQTDVRTTESLAVIDPR